MRGWAAGGQGKQLILAVESLRARDIWPSRQEVFACAGMLD